MEAAESPPSISMTEPLPPSLMFFLSSFHHLIPFKLTEQNYTIWKLQCEGALKASSLFEYIQRSQAPSPTIVGSTGNSVHNPVFSTWVVVDGHIRSCLIATLTPDLLTQVVHTSSARDLWVFLKQKFEKSNSSENLNLQPSSLAICQICANRGHDALDCRNRFVKNSRPANSTIAYLSPSKTSHLASDKNANKVFDGSPNRDGLAIADGSADSAANTGSDIVRPAHGTMVLSEPEMSVLNQSDSRFSEDRLALSLEEIIGCQTREGSGNLEPCQQKSGPQISMAKESSILMTQADKNLSGSKRKAPTPPMDNASDPSSNSLKINKTACFSANCERSVGNKDDIGLSPKETGNAVEHTRTSNDQTTQNSHEKELGGKSLPVYKRLKCGNAVVHVGTAADQNSPEIQVEANSLQVDKQLNGGNAVVLVGSDDQMTQNSQEIQVEENSLQVDKKLNGGNAIVQVETTDDQMTQNSQETQVERSSLQSDKQLNGGDTVVLVGTDDEQMTQNSQEMQVEGNSLQVDKQLNGGNTVVLVGTDDQMTQNSQEVQVERNALQVDKLLNGGNADVLVGTTYDQMTQDSQEMQVEGNSSQVDKQLNGCNAVVLVGTTDDQMTQDAQAVQLEGNSLQLNEDLNGGKAVEGTVTVQRGRWICWSRPPPGMVALHFDGSVRDGSAAGGGVFRNHDGLFLAAFSVHLDPGTVNEAEADALKAGLLFARARGIPVDCIYGDSSWVVNAVTGTVTSPPKILPSILEIKSLLSGAAIAHTNRQGNMVADALAALGHGLPVGFLQSYLSQEELPIPVRWLLFQDRRDFEYFRPH